MACSKMNIYPQLLIVILCVWKHLFAAPAVSQPGNHVAIQREDDVKRPPIGTHQFWIDRDFRWSYGIIPYVISRRYSKADVRIIQRAMQEWEAKTCIRFRPRRSIDVSYVEITPYDGTDSYCYSWVGRQGGRQFMKMFGECMRNGAMIHELGHAIGFNHEHQRPDRDEFILIHLENVNPDFHFAFDLFTEDMVDTMGTNYDFSSVMHYPFFAFTEFYDETRPSMTLLDGSIDAIYREAEFLSLEDIRKTHSYYENCTVARIFN